MATVLKSQGELVGVVGRVGSGKSSLLSAITAEMIKLQGDVSVACVGSGFGLASQVRNSFHSRVYITTFPYTGVLDPTRHCEGQCFVWTALSS